MKIGLKTSALPDDAEEELEKITRSLVVSDLRWKPKVPRSRRAASYVQR